MGREARSEYNEDIEPEIADEHTMGLSCLLQARESSSPKEFKAPPFAHVYEDDSALPNRPHTLDWKQNFWWMEIGGMSHSIHDGDAARDELLRIAYGVWDHIKNRGDHGAENWVLEWVGFLPGKRESRRYIGDHIITQNDVRSEGKFEDIVAYGGWSMDDHHPGGFNHPGKPTVFHPAPSPWGIPYRALYSRNIENLFCAGRNISATHAAMSSSRVMATCAIIGEAVGVAASLAIKYQCAPRMIHQSHISELQTILLDDDLRIPGLKRKKWNNEQRLKHVFDKEVLIEEVRIIFDSDSDSRGKNMPSSHPISLESHKVPGSLVKSFIIESCRSDGIWKEMFRNDDNYQRYHKIKLGKKINGIRLVPTSTWNNGECRVLDFDLR
jgi:hypothetical protein